MSKPYGHKGKENGVTILGDRLKKERMRRGFGLKEFAEMAGVYHTQVTGCENRGVYPQLKTLIAMAETLECSLDWLVGLEN